MRLDTVKANKAKRRCQDPRKCTGENTVKPLPTPESRGRNIINVKMANGNIV